MIYLAHKDVIISSIFTVFVGLLVGLDTFMHQPVRKVVNHLFDNPRLVLALKDCNLKYIFTIKTIQSMLLNKQNTKPMCISPETLRQSPSTFSWNVGWANEVFWRRLRGSGQCPIQSERISHLINSNAPKCITDLDSTLVKVAWWLFWGHYFLS